MPQGNDTENHKMTGISKLKSKRTVCRKAAGIRSFVLGSTFHRVLKDEPENISI